jgi:predicted transcriptional regulator
MNNLNTTMNENSDSASTSTITQPTQEWRRSKVLELVSKGHNQAEIAKILQVSQPTISRDLEYIHKESKGIMEDYLTSQLPTDIRRTLLAIDDITKSCWQIAEESNDERVKLDALRLVNNVMQSRTDLLSNVDVIKKISNLAVSVKEYEERRSKQLQDMNRDAQEQQQQHQKKQTEEQELSQT